MNSGCSLGTSYSLKNVYHVLCLGRTGDKIIMTELLLQSFISNIQILLHQLRNENVKQVTFSGLTWDSTITTEELRWHFSIKKKQNNKRSGSELEETIYF